MDYHTTIKSRCSVAKSRPTLLQPYLWTVACQAPLSIWDFPGENTVFPLPSLGDLPDPGIKPRSSVWQDSLPLSHLGKVIVVTLY